MSIRLQKIPVDHWNGTVTDTPVVHPLRFLVKKFIEIRRKLSVFVFSLSLVPIRELLIIPESSLYLVQVGPQFYMSAIAVLWLFFSLPSQDLNPAPYKFFENDQGTEIPFEVTLVALLSLIEWIF